MSLNMDTPPQKITHVEKWVQKMGEKGINKWLAFISFIESSFFPIPPDPFLMVATYLNPKKWLRYALIVSLFSVIGGLFGYLIGFYFFDIFGQKLVDTYNLQTQFNQVELLFEKNAFLSIFVSAFTPIPYKIFTIAGGFFKINIFTFIIASIIGRSLRFFLVGFIAKMFGKIYGQKFLKFVDIGMLLLVILIVLYSLHSFI